MFNKEYEFNIDQITDLLHFPHGESFIYETSLNIDWPHEVGEGEGRSKMQQNLKFIL